MTISTDSQPSSIQFIDDVKLDFNMQVLDDLEKDEKAEAKVKADSEINNNVSKTKIKDEESPETVTMGKFLTEIVFKGDDSAIEDMTTSEENAGLTSSTISQTSSEGSSPPTMTSRKTITLTNVPLSTSNFIKHERKQTEKNFVPRNNEINFENTSSSQREPQKRVSQIEQIRQNFEKSAQNSNEIPAPIPVARRSSIPLSVQKSSPSKIPVFNKTSPKGAKTSPKSRSAMNSRLSSSTDSVG